MTQRQVATRAGISEQVYSQVKYGRNESPETVRSICLVLGLDPADVWQDISAEAAEARLDSATA